jgi:alpha-galactosidase
MASRKISFIGAGSSVFTAQLVSDFLATEGRDGGTFGLVDIDRDRLDLSARVTRELVAGSGKDWEGRGFDRARRDAAWAVTRLRSGTTKE